MRDDTGEQMKKWLIPLTIWVVDLLGLVLAKKTDWFSDWYVKYVQPIWVGTLGLSLIHI